MNYKQNLDFYYVACNKVAQMFATQYFGKIDDLDEWWVADDVGTVLCINDYFWNMDDMVEALKVGVNKKTIFEYYDWMVDDNPLIVDKSLHFFLNLKKINK